MQESGLARTRRPHHRDGFTLADLQGDTRQNWGRGERFRDVVDNQRRLRVASLALLRVVIFHGTYFTVCPPSSPQL